MNNGTKKSLGAQAPKDDSSFNRLIFHLDKLNNSINSFIHDISKLLLLFMMFIVFGNVITRFFFNNSIEGAHEMTGLALALIVFFSLGATQMARDHISIDFLMKKFPRLLREWVNIFSFTIILILLMFTSVQLFQSAIRAFQGNEQTGDLGLPIYLFQIFAGIGILIFSLAILIELLKTILKVVQKDAT